MSEKEVNPTDSLYILQLLSSFKGKERSELDIYFFIFVLVFLKIFVFSHTTHHIIALKNNNRVGVAQLVGVSSCKPRGRGFDSQSGHMPGLQSGCVQEAPINDSLSH